MFGKKSEDVKEVNQAPFFKKNIFLTHLLLFIFFSIVILFIFDNPFLVKTPACGDGTVYNSCSLVKPYYCENGSFIDKASVCGCFDQVIGNSCNSSFQITPKNIPLNYILNGNRKNFSFPVYVGMNSYISALPRSISYQNGEIPSRENFSLKEINDGQQSDFLLPLVIAIENITNNKEDQVRIAVSLVQNIPYGFSNKTTRFLGVTVNYSRYPYEVLYDNQGVCGEKSELLAFLLKNIGYNTVLFYFPKENHEAVGIKCPLQYSYKNTGYCFVETTGPSIISDSSLDYVGGVMLESSPEIIPISSGISLGNDLQEYQDTRTLDEIKNGNLILFPNSKFQSLKEKYGLTEYYYIS